MTSPENQRYISACEAAGLIGRRYHADWSDTDPDALGRTRDADPEAFDRANHVQTLLRAYVAGGDVRAYQDAPPDGTGRDVIPIPRKWYTPASFTICIRTSRFFVYTDTWEPIYIDRAGLLGHLPKIPGTRKPGRVKSNEAAWKLALTHPEVPTVAELNRQLAEWFAERDDLHPDPSTLTEITREVVSFLKENKTGRGVCESLTPHDPPSEME